MKQIKGLVVSLEHPIGEDYAQELSKLFSMMRGVASVTISEDNFDDTMNREMMRSEFKQKILDVVLK